MTSDRTITNLRVIAGIFRECIVARTDIKINDANSCRVVNIEESSRRSKTDQRKIYIATDASEVNSGKANLDIFLNNFKLSSSVFLEKTPTGDYIFDMPQELVVTNLRNEKRIEPKYANIPSTTVLLLSDNFHQEVPFELVNISKFGLAGDIEINRRETINPGSSISGKLVTVDGNIDVNGRIISTNVLKVQGDTKFVTIRVLRETEVSTSSVSSGDDLDRRKEPRFTSRFDMTVQSLLMPLQTIDFDVVDVSVTGFSAKCKTPLMQSFLVPGVPLRLKDSTLIAHVFYQSEDTIRCQWTDGNDEDRGHWLKKITPFISESTSLSTPEAAELFEIFCESGAFSGEFLRTERSRYESVINGINSESIASSYIHRWIDRKSTNEALGQISFIRMGDNAWFGTDLVKGIEENQNFSSHFVQKFMNSFGHYAKSLKPTPRIFLVWVKNHPYWMPYFEKIGGIETPDLHQMTIGYLRTPILDNQYLARSDVSIREISAYEYKLVEDVLKQISHRGPVELAKSFDFDIDRLGSPRLASAIGRDKKIFWRKYFYVESPKCKGLAVITALPDGMNPNRVIDSGWFFPFHDSIIADDRSWLEIAMVIKKTAALNGLLLAGLRRVSSVSSFELLACEHAEMTGILGHPKILSEFG